MSEPFNIVKRERNVSEPLNIVPKTEKKGFIYIASNHVFEIMSIIKGGCTMNPKNRLGTYLTGCPPGLEPSQDIKFIGLWETDSTNTEDLKEYEEHLFERFGKFRLQRKRPFDSEWFKFKDMSITDVTDMIRRFMNTRPWVIREVPVDEVKSLNISNSERKGLNKKYRKNLKYIKNSDRRNRMLDQIQEPIINGISMFMEDAIARAGYIIAPCGSGKTRMACDGIRGIRKCVICCPRNQIQIQWFNTLLSRGIFTSENIHIIGGDGTTDIDQISKFFDNDVYCIITTYASSHLLVNRIKINTELIILDEAHHMAGIASDDDTGEGKTRKLLEKGCDLNIKRLSLTFTPRFIRSDIEEDIKYFTMDDSTIFGHKIAEIKLRYLIDKGILPDYRLWCLYDEDKKGSGIIGKAELILEAWNQTVGYDNEEKYIINHLIVYTQTLDEGKKLEKYFKENTTDTTILNAVSGNVNTILKKFERAERSIIINCQVLGEGVDSPIADSVAITYPKKSRGQITQMILRAGRWYKGKSLFHILIPTLGDEDLSGYGEVLYSLASCDKSIEDEILLRIKHETNPSESLPFDGYEEDIPPENIIMETFGSDASDLFCEMFKSVRGALYRFKDTREIQNLCLENNITTSLEYSRFREDHPDIPEDPRYPGMTWFEYLNPKRFKTERIPVKKFVTDNLEKYSLNIAHKYTDWLQKQPSDIRDSLPSVQNITDGFFKEDSDNFNILIEKYGTKRITRRR